MTKLLFSAQQLRWLLLLTSLLLAAGFVTPMLTLTKFVVVSNSFSIISGIWQLLQEGHIALFILVAAFSVVLPVAKIILLLTYYIPTPQNLNAVKNYYI